MNAIVPLAVDAAAIGQFVSALFRYADPDSFVSLRTFAEGGGGAHSIEAHAIGDSLHGLANAATRHAQRAARAADPSVFAPPVATFRTSGKADEANLANGLTLSVECDATPDAARARLESLLGPATVAVASGGEWINPATGEITPKLHLHWRLNEPTTEPADHARLKVSLRRRPPTFSVRSD